MDSLYAKLYDRYTKLKSEKFGELEQLSKEQEEKFVSHAAAADKLIQHLMGVNDKLQTKVKELIASARSSVDGSVLEEHQRLLMEEIHKNKELSEEVERLRKMQKEGDDISVGKQYQSGISSNGARKRTWDSTDGIIRYQDNVGEAEEVVERHPKRICLQETLSPDAVHQLKCCCNGVIGGLGDGLMNDKSSSCKCLFQALIQYILGMQVSVSSQAEGMCIRALHESSGLCFSLRLMENGKEEVEEIMYIVESLGTYERVAPEWMGKVIKFNTSMCPTFFERITRLINLHHMLAKKN